MSGDLDLSLWSPTPTAAEPGSPEGPLEVGESDEAHEATSAALARFLADRLDPELPSASRSVPRRDEDVVQPLDRALRRLESRAHPSASDLQRDDALGKSTASPGDDAVEDSVLMPFRLQPASEARRTRPAESSARLVRPVAESSPRLARERDRDTDVRDRPLETRRPTGVGSRPYPTMTAATPAPRGARWLLGAAVIAAVVLVAAGVTMAIQRRGGDGRQAIDSPSPVDSAALEAPIVAEPAAPKTGHDDMPSAPVEVSSVTRSGDVPAAVEVSSVPQGGDASSATVVDVPAAPVEAPSVPQSGDIPPAPRLEPDPAAGAEPVIDHCRARDGVAARKLFRALVGADARSRAILVCREIGVDVTATSEGPTAAEYLEQARAAYAAKELEQAYTLARNSNREHTSSEALELMATIGCDLRQRDKVKHVIGMLLPRNREKIVTYCRGRGVRVK